MPTPDEVRLALERSMLRVEQLSHTPTVPNETVQSVEEPSGGTAVVVSDGLSLAERLMARVDGAFVPAVAGSICVAEAIAGSDTCSQTGEEEPKAKAFKTISDLVEEGVIKPHYQVPVNMRNLLSLSMPPKVNNEVFSLGADQASLLSCMLIDLFKTTKVKGLGDSKKPAIIKAVSLYIGLSSTIDMDPAEIGRHTLTSANTASGRINRFKKFVEEFPDKEILYEILGYSQEGKFIARSPETKPILLQ